MSSNKSNTGLGPLVECSEPQEHEEASAADTETKGHDVVSMEPRSSRSGTQEEPRGRIRATPSKSSDGGIRQKKRGSRLSLASLFSFTGHSALSRERSRSGWSYNDEASGSVAMSSVSASDIRAAVAGSISSKRYRGSDAGSCMDGESEHCADLLLPEEEEEVVEDRDSKDAKKDKKTSKHRECPLCATRMPSAAFPRLKGCQHRSCRICLRQYVELAITENRVEVSCPECSSFLHPSDIQTLVGDIPGLVEKYEQFSVRRYLMTEGDARWCPAPDCGYAVIASRCAACPQLKCERQECGMLFCYHCKREWHNNQTCDEARRGEKRKSRGIGFEDLMRNGPFHPSQDSTLKPGDVKACPRCRTYIVKMDDGSCNHMVCTMCNAEFCWLCLKEISDLHYLSPTGCTFWGKKPWTRKKKLLWQLGTLIGAPVGIALIAGLSIPGIVFGVPVFVGKKVHQRFKYQSKAKRRFLTATCVVGSLIVSPVMAVMAVGVGVPIMLAYVYGVVPLSLCRNGGCGLIRTQSQAQLDSIDEEQLYGTAAQSTQEMVQIMMEDRRDEVASIEPSLHSGLSVPEGSRSHLYRLPGAYCDSRRRTSIESGERVNYEEASVRAMAGSHYYDDKSLHTLCSGHEVISIEDEQASTKALSGSMFETKSLSESVGRHLAAKYTDKFVDRDRMEDRYDLPEVTFAASSNSTKIDEAGPSNSTPHPVKSKISGPLLRTCIEDGEEVLLLSEEAAASLLNYSMRSGSHSANTTGSQHDSASELDPFKIRAWLDNMKQMVASDAPQERPYEPSTSSRPINKLRRSGSGRSMLTVGTPVSTSAAVQSTIGTSNVSMPETSAQQKDNVSTSSTSSKRRRRLGFFSNWFNRNK